MRDIVISWALFQRLMEVSGEQMDWFAHTYMDAMHRSLDFPNTPSGEELRSLARECYELLKVMKKQ